MTADVVVCLECPVGTDCAAGSTLEQLPLVRGFYRINHDTTDVRKCPDAAANCSTTFGTSLCESSSGCLGGTDASGGPSGSGLCMPGLEGAFCRTCIQPSHDDPSADLVYYVKASEYREAHCEACGGTVGATILLVVAGLTALVVAGLILKWLGRNKAAFQSFMTTFSPRNKIKILIGFYQLSLIHI